MLGITCVLGSELPTPLRDRLVGDDDSALRQEFLDIAEAQGKSMVRPNGVTDDLERKPVSVVAIHLALLHDSELNTASPVPGRIT